MQKHVCAICLQGKDTWQHYASCATLWHIVCEAAGADFIGDTVERLGSFMLTSRGLLCFYVAYITFNFANSFFDTIPIEEHLTRLAVTPSSAAKVVSLRD